MISNGAGVALEQVVIGSMKYRYPG